ncbi:MAG: cytochrome c biogenesis protein CcdA [Alphaproteobacteria bacterium]
MNELLTAFETLPAASAAAFGLIALAGLIMGVAPSSLPLVSVVVGSVAGRGAASTEPATRRGLLFAGGFVLGIATVDAAIGGLFGFLGYALIRVLAGSLAITNLVLAALLVAMGLALLRVIHVPWLRVQARPREIRSFGGAYALGIPFGLSTCPACTPMVLPVLGAAAASGEAWIGAGLLFTFGVARGIPLLVAGAVTDAAMRLRRVTNWVPRIERTGGVLLLLAALYFIYQSAAAAGMVPPMETLLTDVS